MYLMTLLATAFAGQTYEVEVGVPTVAPATPAHTHWVSRVLFDVLPSPMSVSVQSTSPWITCRANGTDVIIDVNVDAPALASMPMSADCKYGSDTLRVFLIPTTDFGWLLSPNVVDFNQGVTIPTPTTSIGWSVYRLPPGLGYSSGIGQTYDANGDPWDGVYCETAKGPTGAWFVRLQLDYHHGRGKGSCDVLSDTANPHTLSVSIQDP